MWAQGSERMQSVTYNVGQDADIPDAIGSLL
jgi:hypothetical protein